MLKAGSQIRNREFAHALNVVKHDGAETLKNLVNDRVTTHEKKPGVTAKTVGQKRYLDAIRKHDITFGVVAAQAKPIWRSHSRSPLCAMEKFPGLF